MRVVDLTFWMVLVVTLHEAGAVGLSRFARFDEALEKRDRARRAELRQGLSAVLCGESESNFELRTSNFVPRPSLMGLWWLLGPLLIVVAASFLLRPLFGPAVDRLPASENFHFGLFRYGWFVAAGYLPWILAVGGGCLALRLPALRAPALTFAQLVRAQVLLAWLLLFCGLLGFLADMRLGAGFKVFLAFGMLLALCVNLSLLLARIFRAFAPSRPARLALSALTLLSLVLSPVLYPYEALPHGAARLMQLNPLLPFVRIGQRLLVDQSVPGWRLWLALVAWSAALALVAAFLLPKDAQGRQGSEVVREKRTAA
jgi:ABC-type polysaccharide/polyol phosphate export permease